MIGLLKKRKENTTLQFCYSEFFARENMSVSIGFSLLELVKWNGI